MQTSLPADLMMRAEAHMRMALELLDEADAPPEIGADLDMAIHRLERAMPQFTQTGSDSNSSK